LTGKATNKTNRHDITEILLKVELNTITLTLTQNKLLNPLFSVYVTYSDIPSKWTKLLPLQDNSMEETDSKNDTLPLLTKN
jgi:hypothetical protein